MGLAIGKILAGVSAAVAKTGIVDKIKSGFGKLKGGLSSGVAAVRSSNTGGAVPESGIRSWLHGGSFLSAFRIQYIIRFVILIAVILGLLGIAGLTIGAESLQGISSSIRNLFGNAVGGIEEGSQLYLEQYQLATGQRYASEVDEYADTDVGVNLAEVTTTQATYQVNDPVTLWGKIDVKVMKSEQPITVDLTCRNVKNSAEGKDIVEYGEIKPQSQHTVYDTETVDFRCQFQEGILVNDWDVTNEFYTTADFNFMTMAYVTLNFMDENAFRALENNDPERVAALSVSPVSKNTQGPLEMGIGTNRNPILIYNSSVQAKSYLGISFTNTANGKINNLTRLDVLIPKGVKLIDCDSAISFVQTEPSDPEMAQYFTNFTLVQESLEHLSEKLNAETSYGQTSQYLAQNVRCFLEFQPEEIFSGKSRLDPVQLNVFAFADYDYQVEEYTSIAVERDNSGTAVQVEPKIVGVNSQFECKALKTTGNKFVAGTFTLKYRKAGSIESKIVEGYNNIPVSCPGDFCVMSVNVPDLPMNPEIGDYLTCQFTIDRENEEETTSATKLVKILNTPPVVQDVYFSPNSPAANQDLTCIAKISDEEQTNLETVQFKFRKYGEQTVIDGVCEDTTEPGVIQCKGLLSHSKFSENNVVECSVHAFDGTDSNDDEGTISITIGPDSESESVVDSRECSDTDGGQIYYTRGSVSGETATGDATIEQDECASETSLKEYYCDSENIVQSIIFDCDCVNGACY